MDPELTRDLDRHTPPGWSGIESPEGWDTIVAHLHTQLKEIDPDYKIYQIKSKFGGLRYYCHVKGDADKIRNLIAAAEAEAARTCETCGAPGVLRNVRGWWRTACPAHTPEGAEEIDEAED